MSAKRPDPEIPRLTSTGAPNPGTEEVAGDDPRIARISTHVRGMLTELGLNLEDENLRETDRRVAKMYLEMFRGLEQGAEPKVTTFPNDEHYSAMVME
ncbi:MAG: GTP cyclohydrolase I, partial [Thermoanaerobaculia bacterium]